MKIGQTTDNLGRTINYIKELKKDDILIAKKSVTSKGDIGMSNLVYNYEAFIPGKKYKVHHIYDWKWCNVAYVADEDNTLHFATPEIFDIFVE